MKTINLKANNTLACPDCEIAFEYEKADVQLSPIVIEGQQYLQPVVHCPNCGKQYGNLAVEMLPEVFTDYKDLKKKTLNDYTFAEISEIAASGKAEDYFKLHDKKSIILQNGEVHRIEIIGFNHDNVLNKSNHQTTAGITFRFANLLGNPDAGDAAMNDEATNEGGWKKSEMRRYLNEDVFKLLPQELQECIKPVVKTTYEPSTENKLTQTVDKLFLLSEVEVFGTARYSKEGEGRQYEGLQSLQERVLGYCPLTYKYEAYACCYWLRSPGSGNSYSFCFVSNGGGVYYYGAYSEYGVSPCFAI